MNRSWTGPALLIFLSLFLVCCKGKKKMLSSNETFDAQEFVQSFSELSLPILLSDTTINNRLSDSALINPNIISQFVPDSLFRREFPKGTKPRFYAMGKAEDKNGDNYLLIKAATAAKQAGYILCYDKTFQYKAGMLLVTNSADRNIHLQGGLDRKFTIIRNRIKQLPDGQQFYSKQVYVYNTAGIFTLIVTESNESLDVKEVYNPIDTLSHANKLSGDYVIDKKNFISIRDGAKPGRLMFFIHFEKNSGECTGELKGEAEIVKPNLAHYSASGDPCALEFSFNGNKLSIQEMQGCGNYRGIRCFFEGSYPKKIVKPKAVPKAASKKKK